MNIFVIIVNLNLGKFYQIISFHAGNYRKLKCPVCGVVGLAQEVKDIKWLLDYANITILI